MRGGSRLRSKRVLHPIDQRRQRLTRTRFDGAAFLLQPVAEIAPPGCADAMVAICVGGDLKDELTIGTDGIGEIQA